jgi:hypothetical protein
VAEREKETTNERSATGRHRVAKAGRWLGGAVAYGYIVIRIRFERRIRIVADAEKFTKGMSGTDRIEREFIIFFRRLIMDTEIYHDRKGIQKILQTFLRQVTVETLGIVNNVSQYQVHPELKFSPARIEEINTRRPPVRLRGTPRRRTRRGR